MNKLALLTIAALGVSLSACDSSEEDNVVTPDSVIYGPYSTGTASEPVAVYFDLDTNSEVELTDEEALTNTEWDIGFKRTVVFLNTAQSTPVSVAFTGNNSDFYDSDGVAVADSFLNATADSELEDFTAVTYDSIPDEDTFSTDIDSEVIGSSFYNYDFTTHVVSAASDVHYIVYSDGNYTKFNVTDIVTEGYGIGSITFDIYHQSIDDGQSEFSASKTVTLDAVSCSENLYIDFDIQEQVTSADDWDLALPCSSGAGDFSLSLADDATVIVTDADSYTGIDPDYAAYYGFTSNSSTEYAFDSNPWYYYDSSSHLLYSQYGVYIVKTEEANFKFQITSYYDDEGTSGSYSFRSEALESE